MRLLLLLASSLSDALLPLSAGRPPWASQQAPVEASDPEDSWRSLLWTGPRRSRRPALGGGGGGSGGGDSGGSDSGGSDSGGSDSGGSGSDTCGGSSDFTEPRRSTIECGALAEEGEGGTVSRGSTSSRVDSELSLDDLLLVLPRPGATFASAPEEGGCSSLLEVVGHRG